MEAQTPTLSSRANSGFPVRPGGVGKLDAAFLKKAAYVAVDESGVVGNPEEARDDKVRVCASM
jgi:hypothetical protein